MKSSLIIKDIPRLDKLTSEQIDEIAGGLNKQLQFEYFQWAINRATTVQDFVSAVDNLHSALNQ